MGIFTERDLIKRVLAPRAEFGRPVRDFMTEKPVTCLLSDPVGCVIRKMYEGHYRHLPVVDEDRVPTGIVSAKGIVQYLVDHFPSAVYNLPPTPRQVQEAREGA